MALTVALPLSTPKLAPIVIAMVSLIAYVFLGQLIKVVQVVSTSGTGTKRLKSMSFYQYSWNSEAESTWKSLNGWPHRMPTNY